MYSNQKYNDLEKIISNVLHESQGNDMISDYSFPEVTKKIYEQLSLHYTFKEIPNEDKSLRAFMSKEQIKVLLDAFEKANVPENITTNLTVVGHIQGKPFNSKFLIEKSNPSLLMSVLNPFFEDMEDYETCAKIVKLYNSLKTN